MYIYLAQKKNLYVPVKWSNIGFYLIKQIFIQYPTILYHIVLWIDDDTHISIYNKNVYKNTCTVAPFSFHIKIHCFSFFHPKKAFQETLIFIYDFFFSSLLLFFIFFFQFSFDLFSCFCAFI